LAAKKASKSAGKWRPVCFFIFLFLSLAVATVLIALPEGILKEIGEWLRSSLGFLSAFLPVFLFLAGAGILRLGFAGKWLRATGAVFISSFFLSAVVTAVLCRIQPELISLTGGRLTAKSVLAVESLVGGVIGWIAFFLLFMISLVVFTRWDISADINSLLSRFSGKKPKRVPAAVTTSPEPAPEKHNNRNVWSNVEEPSLIPEPETQPAPARKRNPVVPPVPAAMPIAGNENEYRLPGVDFLALPSKGERNFQTEKEIKDRADILVEKLAAFGVECKVEGYCPGPVLTRYELKPGPGVKVNRILNLADDLSLALAAKRIRILAPIPGKGAVGIEIPNKNPETVYLRELLQNFNREIIPVALGKRLEGEPFIADLTEMPHLLIAGATGSGKSVCVHAIISTILLTRTPYQVKLAMIDPKMLELSAYTGIPHLWAPVIIQTAKAKYLLEALVREMEDRYALLARTGVRSIAEYNRDLGKEQAEEHLPYIVVIIDELADLMMTCSRDVEPPIARLAQMARAVGIHLVVATQRPSVDVITGVIKANFPSRIAFNVQSMTDSRTILDMNGAEKLLGQGDMLFVPAASPEPVRVHGSYVSTGETKALVDFWSRQPAIAYEYEPPEDGSRNLYDPGELDFDDPLLEDVKDAVIAQQRASVSMIQRKFRVGYARAGKLIDMLERMGVVGPHVGSKPREVLVSNESEEEKDE
jgi:S-DNA-T family DNA segregation ATPase FtsK/SpoIIIE